MGANRQTKYYSQYVSALKKLIEAQNKAKEFCPSVALHPVEEHPELTSKGRRAFQRLDKAYKLYAEKSHEWRDYLKTYGL